MTIKAQTGLSKRRDGEGKPIGPLVTGREYQRERCVTGEECLPTGAAPCAPGGGIEAVRVFFTPPALWNLERFLFPPRLDETVQLSGGGGERQG